MVARFVLLIFQGYFLYPPIFGSTYSYMVKEKVVEKHCTLSDVSLFCKSVIPEHIPNRVENVYIADYNILFISQKQFYGTNWINVSTLDISSITSKNVTVKAYAFRTLANITVLGLHGDRMYFGNDAFNGIMDLHTLDLSECRKFNFEMISHALQGAERIRHIEVLDISQIGTYTTTRRNNIDEYFSTVLGQKNISRIVARGNSIRMINFTAFEKHLCNSLVDLDFSNTTVVETTYFSGKCATLKYLYIDNIGYIKVIPFALPENIQFDLNLTNYNLLNFFVNVPTLYARKLAKLVPPLKNITINSLSKYTIKTKSFVLSNNGLQYIDLRFSNVTSDIENFDLSSNGMEFLNIQLDGSCRLKTIDLSDNNFHEMAEHNSTLFEILFKNCSMLETVNMSCNSLTDVPEDMFTYNSYLRVIDLSNNKIEQVNFNLDNNRRLLELNLKGNNIARLSGSSINRLSMQLSHENKFVIDLKKNPLICNNCNNKGYIGWIVKNQKNILTDGCVGEDETKQIDESTVKSIEKICDREARIIYITTLTACCVVVLVSISVLTIMKWRKRKKKHKHRKIIEEFQKGESLFEFPVFLSYCGDDEEFVYTYVVPPLKEHLRVLIGVDRELICTGDRHFKLGHTIAEQTSCCYDRASVIILVVSHEFCASNHCTYEAHIAFTMGKPIILMFKDQVTIEEMPSAMKVIFKQNTRITWKKHGDEYVMPTTWQNVCQSILDLTHYKIVDIKGGNDEVNVDI